MDKLAKHSWPSYRHVGDHRVASGYRCRDLDDVLTFPRGPATDVATKPARPPLVPGCRGSAVRRPLGNVATYHRLHMCDCVTNM